MKTKYEVLGLRIEQFVGQSVSGHNCDFEYSPEVFEKHVLLLKDMSGYKYEYSLWQTEGECGSGWCSATFGESELKHVNNFASKTHTIIQQTFIEEDLTRDVDNDVFTLSYDGVFEPTYLNHYYLKSDCPSCQFKTKEEYIDIFKTVHNDKYDYSLVQFNSVSDKIKIICPKHGVFEQRLAAHKCGQTCPSCVSYSSKEENKWLDSLNIPTMLKQYSLFKNHIVDGYDPKTNTVYQYHGVYWHGHPDFFDQNEKHPHFKKKTFGEIYQRTLDRDESIRQAGYNLVIKWSHE